VDGVTTSATGATRADGATALDSVEGKGLGAIEVPSTSIGLGIPLAHDLATPRVFREAHSPQGPQLGVQLDTEAPRPVRTGLVKQEGLVFGVVDIFWDTVLWTRSKVAVEKPEVGWEVEDHLRRRGGQGVSG